MSKYRIEIIPPGELIPDEWRITDSYLRAHKPPGLIDWLFGRSNSERAIKEFQQLTAEMNAAREFFEARQKAIEGYLKAQEHEWHLRALPRYEALATERLIQQQSQQLGAVVHDVEVERLVHERASVEAQTAAVAARQALQVQLDLGSELALKKHDVDLLDFELATAERRAVLRQHLRELDRDTPPSSNQLEDVLYEARAQLNAHGLDTSRIDAIIEQRRDRWGR